jgi:GTP cyclohydrolase I
MSQDVIHGFTALIDAVGDDSTREGVIKTPARALKAWQEMCSGYRSSPADILSTSFDLTDVEDAPAYSGLVLLRDIDFASSCEHHMLPFIGRAHVGYIPGSNGRVVGLSKLARLVDCYARRLQCQERLTEQIAQALEDHLRPLGVIVVIDAEHFCMRLRGVKKATSKMTTSSLRGVLLHDHAARAEALTLIHKL